MAKKKKALSQAEIWDDSALIQSWDDALTEYKARLRCFTDCRIIHARGERVEDVLQEAEAPESSANGKPLNVNVNDLQNVPDATTEAGELLEDGEVEEGSQINVSMAIDHPEEFETDPSIKQNGDHTQSEVHEIASQKGPPAFPQSLTVGSTQDESLKNLMMSWYWAGYYTGHHEGLQQALRETALQRDSTT
ncbi:hypothetical protein MMC09_002094 [Bachmanniomyces sp. S44760]|nr:hypothetical protein [Bachmanniomyces sp. S44760]